MPVRHQSEDTTGYPLLGRLFSRLDRPVLLFRGLAVACVLIFLADFAYEKHTKIAAEDLPGFFAVFGFVAFSAVIFLARALRVLVKRPEDYYGAAAVDSEDYPGSGLDRRQHDAS